MYCQQQASAEWAAEVSALHHPPYALQQLEKLGLRWKIPGKGILKNHHFPLLSSYPDLFHQPLFYVWSLRHQKKKKKKDPLPKDREKVGRGINSLWRLPRGSFLTAWLEPSNISDPAIFFLGCCGRIQWCKEHLSWKKITSIGKEHSLHFFPTFHQNACHKSFKWNLRKHYYGISLGSVSNYILSLLYLTGYSLY